MDLIAGVSIGGIIALCLAFGITLEEIESFFLEKAKKIFTVRTCFDFLTLNHTASKNSNRPNTVQKLLMLVRGQSWYESPHQNSEHGSNILQLTLQHIFGDTTLQDLKLPVLIPAYQQNTRRFIMFSNIKTAFCTGQTARVVDVARATSAAPLYLPPYSFGGNTYLDGGIGQNNPALLALTLAKILYASNLPKQYCLLSAGTGINKEEK